MLGTYTGQVLESDMFPTVKFSQEPTEIKHN